jgi:hypothetical protein
MCEYGTLKAVYIICKRGRGKRNNNRGDEPNLGTLYAYMKMSQQNHAITIMY